jgi:flagellin
MVAQRRLGESSNELASVFERLASGQRLNRASDDAAGLAIADRLGAERRLWGQSVANINDGISAIAITDGALDQRGGILQRLNELAEQSANGTFSSLQRGSLSTEYRELLRELGRLREATTFNGIDLFDPNNSLSLQVGITGGANSRIGLEGIDLGNSEWTINTSELLNVADFDQNGGVDNGDRDAFILLQQGATLAELEAKFGSNWATTSVVASDGSSRQVFIGAVQGANGLEFMTFTANAEGTAYTGNARNFGVFEAAWQVGGGGTPVLPSTNFTLSDGLGAAGYVLDLIGTPDTSGTFTLDYRMIRLSDSSASRPSGLYVSGVESVERSRAALEVISDEIEALAAQRGKLGASESRLKVALNLSFVARENSAAAEGRIRDADIAAESARLVRLQILQQIGATVLQTAASQPQLALRLLQG